MRYLTHIILGSTYLFCPHTPLGGRVVAPVFQLYPTQTCFDAHPHVFAINLIHSNFHITFKRYTQARSRSSQVVPGGGYENNVGSSLVIYSFDATCMVEVSASTRNRIISCHQQPPGNQFYRTPQRLFV